MTFDQCFKQWTIPFLTLYGFEVEVLSGEDGFMLYTQPGCLLCCACNNTLRKGNLLFCSFSISPKMSSSLLQEFVKLGNL